MLYQQLAVFLTAFLKNHGETVCEELAKTSNEGHQQLMFAMNLLVDKLIENAFQYVWKYSELMLQTSKEHNIS